ncbi:hypothetical protein SAMN05443665_10811 [Actinomadura meyerae]|uniref:Uncharacterized protein n=1 Tax=Actinomadura meyerae TaxID=240840 RepID=A0A239P7B6_9ACTN|nr:hypothetical protein [Actinomadura meyerae]SNT62931.1 hypothetical protein SAMN05443665_10811 [Actinomadura meyerae]
MRGRLPKTFPLPASDGSGQVLVHEIWMRESEGYVPSEELHIHSDLSEVSWLGLKREPSGAIRIDRHPVWASYPVTRRTVRLGTLAPGQSMRYRANFRLSGYSMTWTYYDWTVSIAHEAPESTMFLGRQHSFERDDRVSLYGKPSRRQPSGS